MTDIFQFLILFAVLPFLTVLAISKVGSIKAVFMQVPAAKLTIWGHEKFSYYLTLFLVWSIFPVGITSPPLFQRLLMAGRANQARNLYLTVAAFDFPFQLAMMMLGLAAIVLYPTIEAKLALPHIINDILPVGLKGLAMAGMLAVVMSTADSYLSSAGLLFSHDVIKPLCDRLQITLDELRWARYSTILIGCGAIFIGLQATSSLSLSFKALQFTGPLLMFPLIAGILGLKPDQRSFYVAAVVTIMAFILATVLLPPAQSHLAVLISILANGMALFGSHFVQNKGFVIVERGHNGVKEVFWKPRRETMATQLKRWVPTSADPPTLFSTKCS